MPITRVFVDTNILLYAASVDPSEQLKADKALQVLQDEPFGLSAQVLQEFYVNATKRALRPMSSAEALAFLAAFDAFPIVALDRALFIEAVSIKDRYRISYWDAAILAAAKKLGASTLYSEDLSHGQSYEGVTVINPFR